MAFIQLVAPARVADGRDALLPRRPDRQAHNRRGEMVARVTTFVDENLGESITVSALSQMAGVSERTLRTAFREVVGLSPKQYAIAQRLQAAREALVVADPKSTTVTEIAMTYGFFELGRFAGRYRMAYGETPSGTLRRQHSLPLQAA